MKHLYVLFTSILSFAAIAQSGGEDQNTATIIPAIPFVGSGSTMNALDDYNESCPDYANAGGGKDHVYRYDNGNTDITVRVSLCEAVTNFDSQLYVYVDSCSSGTSIACQEDGCQSPAYSSPYNSEISPLLLEAGKTYYFVVDGYSASSSGNYQINIDTVPPPPAALIEFSNETSTLLDPSNRNTYSGAPVAVVDVNNDGYDDILRLDNTLNLIVDYNQPNGYFTTYYYGAVSGSSIWAMALADFTGDSILDIVVGSYSSIRVIPGTNGGNSFGPAATISSGYIFSQGINFVDIDMDGDIDIFACNDVGESHIYLNNGSGGFTQSTTTIDMSTNPVSDKSGNYASIWTDYDNDGDLDLYITKCRQGVTDPNDGRRINQLFQNDGQGNYNEVGLQAGLRLGEQSWVTDFGDIDNDGDFDAFVMHHDAPSQLFINQNGNFLDVTSAVGLNNISFAGIQCLFRDFNNDGYVDLITTGGEHRMFVNNGNGTFTEDINGFVYQNQWMLSCAVGDLNRDGYLDVVGTYGNLYNYPNSKTDKVWINQSSGNHYLRVSLAGDADNYRGIGARITIDGPWGTQVREVRSGEGYGIMNSLIQHFGLGAETVAQTVIVTWPDGTVDQLFNVSADQQIEISKGSSPQTDFAVFADSTEELGSGSAEVNGRLHVVVQDPTEIRLVYENTTNSTSDSVLYNVNPASGFLELIDTVSGLSSGNYIAYYKAIRGGQTQWSDTLAFQITNVQLDELENQLNIYPNPSSHWIRIEGAESIGGHLKIIDHSGRVVREFKSISLPHDLDISGLTPGAYHLTFESTNAEVFISQFVRLKH